MPRATRQQRHDPSSFTPAQQAEFERLQINHHLGSDGLFHGPYDGWLLSGDLSRIVNQLVHYVQHDTVLDKGLSELVICIARAVVRGQPGVGGACAVSAAEWRPAIGHGRPARRASDHGTVEQELAYDMCSSLLRDHRLSDELYARAVEHFGERGVMDIVATLGAYSLVSMTLDTFECKTAPAVPSVFARDETQTVAPAEFWEWANARLAAQRM